MKKYLSSASKVALVLVGLLVCSCSSTHQSKISNTHDAITTTTVVTPNVTTGAKVSASAKVYNLLGFKWGDTKYADGIAYSSKEEKHDPSSLETILNIFGSKQYTDEAKAAAAYLACKRNDADILLIPTYNVKHDNYFVFKITTADVSGYEGFVKGVKSVEQKDYREIRAKPGVR